MKSVVVCAMLAAGGGMYAQNAVGVTEEYIVTAAELKSGSWRNRTAGAENLHIQLASDVTDIPERAFADCKNLILLNCAQGSRLKSVGKLAFMGCDRLITVDLPNTVTSLGERCFLECESLQMFQVPAGVSTLPSHCFEWCRSLKEVIIPKGLKKIGSASFMYCFALETINIPYGVTEIGSNAFTECRSLETLTLPSSVRELGSYIASECVRLRSATLPKGLGTMGELMFSGCRSLETLTVATPLPPAFECNSFIFEPDEEQLYRQCVLRVASPEAYRKAHGWKMFSHITGL